MENEKATEKLIYSLEEISRIAGLSPKIIDTWEKEFPFIHAGQTASGKRIFRQRDLNVILRIKELLEKKGYTLAGAKRKIEEEFGPKKLISVHPDRLRKVLFSVREQLQEIAASLEKDTEKI